MIAEYLSVEDLTSCSLVSHSWKTSMNDPEIWAHKVIRLRNISIEPELITNLCEVYTSSSDWLRIDRMSCNFWRDLIRSDRFQSGGCLMGDGSLTEDWNTDYVLAYFGRIFETSNHKMCSRFQVIDLGRIDKVEELFARFDVVLKWSVYTWPKERSTECKYQAMFSFGGHIKKLCTVNESIQNDKTPTLDLLSTEFRQNEVKLKPYLGKSNLKLKYFESAIGYRVIAPTISLELRLKT